MLVSVLVQEDVIRDSLQGRSAYESMWENFHDDVHSSVEGLVFQPQEVEKSVFRGGPPLTFSIMLLYIEKDSLRFRHLGLISFMGHTRVNEV
jgi:hypothetical protein